MDPASFILITAFFYIAGVLVGSRKPIDVRYSRKECNAITEKAYNQGRIDEIKRQEENKHIDISKE